MFEKDEFEKLDNQYFKIFQKTAFHIILMSKNTNHFWDIESKSLFYGQRAIVVHHKHKKEDNFHVQLRFHPRTIDEAQNLIIEHDLWHLNGRKQQNRTRKNAG